VAFRSGFVSIIGKPNAGKSTLLNALLGEKIAIVSEKPQTTRNAIRGVKNLPGAQIVFVDTPGIHKATGLLNEFMVAEALSMLRNVDVVLYIAEALGAATAEDRFIIDGFKRVKAPVVLALNKVDMVAKPALLPVIEGYAASFSFKEIIPISALKHDGLDPLLKALVGLMPEGPMYFPSDEITDQPVRIIAAEMVREKVFRFTSKEVPYSVAVVVENFKEKKKLVSIRAVINVEKSSQKGIIIGKKGAMLKRIGSAARVEIEKLLGSKVYLELFVRVRKDWTKDSKTLKEFGY
jgi:GTP-binding protein Era